MSEDPPIKPLNPSGLGQKHGQEFGQEFGQRKPVVPTAPEIASGIGALLTKRSTVVTLVLAGSAVFLAYNVRFQQSCTAPLPGASPELLAEYERCRARRTSSSGGRSYSWSSGGTSSSSTHSTAARGGFGSTASSHASGHAGGG